MESSGQEIDLNIYLYIKSNMINYDNEMEINNMMQPPYLYEKLTIIKDEPKKIKIINKMDTIMAEKIMIADDLKYLTVDPQVTYFKSVYHRHTHFDFNYKYYDPKINIIDL